MRCELSRIIICSVTINPRPEAPDQVFMGSKESSGSISTISQERPPHSEQMLICVNFKQFKSIFGFIFTNLGNQCWNDSKDKYRTQSWGLIVVVCLLKLEIILTITYIMMKIRST